MPHLRELFQNKKAMLNIAAAFAVGVLLLMMSNSLFTPKPGKTAETPVETLVSEAASTKQADGGYAAGLENRLAEILSGVAGAGKVKVMITLSNGYELVVAEDGKYDKSVTEETDAQGGKRTIEALNTSGTKVMLKGSDGSLSPLIIKTIEPKVAGVIIVAEGGGDATIKEQLIQAAQTVLGVEPHKVQVLKSGGAGR